jgi:hypothetical protein
MMVERRDAEFEVEGGDRLRGWLFVPENGSARHLAISMAHGYAGVKEHGLEHFARTDLQLSAYEDALEPKKLVTIDGGHFDPYLGQFAATNTVAANSFRQHLGQDQ